VVDGLAHFSHFLVPSFAAARARLVTDRRGDPGADLRAGVTIVVLGRAEVDLLTAVSTFTGAFKASIASTGHIELGQAVTTCGLRAASF
jgi:hypothetical protein